MSGAAKTRPVSDMAKARFDRLLAERKDALARVAAADEQIAQFCRKWSTDNGYQILLRPDQVARAIEARKDRGDD